MSADPILPTIDLTPLVAPVGKLLLHNPHNETIHGNFNAESYDAPPGDSELVPKSPKITPLILLRHFCGEDGRSGPWSQIGVRPLYGDPERDAPIKAEAARVRDDWYYNHCLALKLAHMGRVAREKEANVPLTVPDRRTREAMQFIAEHDSKSRAAVLCPHCAWPLEHEKDLQYHVFSFHPEQYDPKQYEAKAPVPAPPAPAPAALTPAQRLGVAKAVKEDKPYEPRLPQARPVRKRKDPILG